MTEPTADFVLVERVPGNGARFCVQLRVWHKAGDQYIIARCSPPVDKMSAYALGRIWARDHKCEFQMEGE